MRVEAPAALRLFIGFELDPPLRARVAEVISQEQLKFDARWVRADKLHLTLLFLGDTPAPKLPELIAGAATVASRHSSFELTAEGAGTFDQKVLWLGVGGALGPLEALAIDLANTLGVKHDHPVYRPHLTLARSSTQGGDPLLEEIARRLNRKSYGAWPVEKFAIYLSASGRYLPLQTFVLQR